MQILSSSGKRPNRLGPDKPPDNIPPGERAYAHEAQPAYSLFGYQDPSVDYASGDVTLEDLHRMTQRDGHARALLNALSLPIRAARRAIDPAEGGGDEAQFIADMLETPPHRGGMTTPLSYVLSAHATAFRDGFRVFEKVVEVREDDRGRHMQVLRQLKPLPATTISFKYDSFGGLGGVVQRIVWDGVTRNVELPPEKVLVYTVGKEERPLRGESMFLPAYYHYDKKHRLYHISHIAAQAGAVAPRVGKIPMGATKDSRGEFLKALQQVGLGTSIMVPAGFEVDALPTRDVLGGIVKLIEHHDVAMSKSILAHFLDIGTEGKSQLGTATSTSELGDLFVVALDAHMQDIAEGINAFVIPYFVDVNFGTARYPTFKFEPFTDAQRDLLRETFKTLFVSERPVAPMLFEIQKHMAEQLGLAGIDWAQVKALFDEEEGRKRELRMIGQDRSIAGMEAMRSSDSSQAPTNPPPIPPKE